MWGVRRSAFAHEGDRLATADVVPHTLLVTLLAVALAAPARIGGFSSQP